MPRAKRIPATRRRKKKIFKRAKGFFGGRSKLYRTAKETVIRAMAFATRDRKKKKRALRNLWVIRVNAGCRQNGISYSKFIGLSKTKNMLVNRKMLSEMAIHEPDSFSALVAFVKN